MSVTIHLGVTEMPYSFGDLGRSKKGKPRASTTGDVAEILEAKYGVMQLFWEKHGQEAIDEMHEALQGAFESTVLGAPASPAPFAAATGKIEEMFQQFIDMKEMDGLAPGVPTAASLAGVNHRFKRKRGPVRPSFKDTGLYESSFRCWVE